MNKEEAIKYLQQLYPNGGHCWLDEQRIEAIGMAIRALQEEPVSEDLGEYINELSKQFPEVSFAKLSRIAVRVAKWQEQKDKEALNIYLNSQWKKANNKTMSRAEKFISEHTKKLTQYGDDYFLWITPDNAKEAVEIAREEIYEWVRVNLCNYFDDTRETFDKFLEDLKQTMKDE